MIPETFERLKDSDRAVSPVIGVILMVAITVILAAVIAAFVLGFGADTEAPPQASVDIQVDGTELTVEHLSGEEINTDNLHLRGEEVDADDEDLLQGNDSLSGGNFLSANFSEAPSGTVNLVWESGDESSVLASTEA